MAIEEDSLDFQATVKLDITEHEPLKSAQVEDEGDERKDEIEARLKSEQESEKETR